MNCKCMRLEAIGAPLRLRECSDLQPGPGEILVRVLACGVCRTDLHIVDGELPPVRASVVPGHEIVGRIEALGPSGEQAGDVAALSIGQRVGIPWLGRTCGHCAYCVAGRENLCDAPQFTGYHRDGGFATHVVADARYCFPLDGIALPDTEAAPLMCAGLIGWRSLGMAGEARTLGLYGFGAAAHLLVQVARAQGRTVFAFTRPGDAAAQAHARALGASWAGGSDEAPAQPLDAAILFAPVGSLVPTALQAVRKGGRVVCAGIHMSDIPSFPYRLLWNERQLLSVANLARRDGDEYLSWVRAHPPRVDTTVYRLEQANQALADLRSGAIQGAAVLVPGAIDGYTPR